MLADAPVIRFAARVHEAGSEGHRPVFMTAQPNGLGIWKNKNMRAEGPFHQPMNRAFSPAVISNYTLPSSSRQTHCASF